MGDAPNPLAVVLFSPLGKSKSFGNTEGGEGAEVSSTSPLAVQPASHTDWVSVYIAHTCGMTFIGRKHMVRHTELAVLLTLCGVAIWVTA